MEDTLRTKPMIGADQLLSLFEIVLQVVVQHRQRDSSRSAPPSCTPLALLLLLVAIHYIQVTGVAAWFSNSSKVVTGITLILKTFARVNREFWIYTRGSGVYKLFMKISNGFLAEFHGTRIKQIHYTFDLIHCQKCPLPGRTANLSSIMRLSHCLNRKTNNAKKNQ